MFVHPVTDEPYGFSHGKGGEDGADTQPFQMPQKEKCHSGGHSQTDYIEGHFNIGIFGVEDFRKFPGNRSVGVIGSPQRLDSAMPKLRIK